jgi:hypothetical protein
MRQMINAQDLAMRPERTGILGRLWNEWKDML